MRALGAVLAATALLTTSGCGFIKAIFNPSAAWAISESTPMSVVVRRAEVAHDVADNVDRLIGVAPIDAALREALALEQTQAQALLEKAASDPIYAGSLQVRVVPAEAWLKAMQRTCGGGTKDDGEKKTEDAKTLIATLGSAVASKYQSVAATGTKIAALKGKVAELEDKASADTASDAEKKSLAEQVSEHEEEITKLKEAYEPEAAKLFALVRTYAGKASAEAKAAMSPVVVNLLEAVDDARNANSAAVMRYPMALPGLKDDLPDTVKRFAGDVIEEQTGHRPDMGGLKPDIKLDGGNVKLTLNGIPHDKLGKLDPATIVTETATRTTDYFGFTITLLAYMSETEERLAFQADLLDAWKTGLAAEVGSSQGTVDISALEVASTPGGAPAGKSEASGESVKRSVGGLRLSACAGPAKGALVAKAQPAKKAAPVAKQGTTPVRKSSDTALAKDPETGTTIAIRRSLFDDKPTRAAPPKKPAAAAPTRTATSPASPASKPRATAARPPAPASAPRAPAAASDPGSRSLPGEDDVPARWVPGQN